MFPSGLFLKCQDGSRRTCPLGKSYTDCFQDHCHSDSKKFTSSSTCTWCVVSRLIAVCVSQTNVEHNSPSGLGAERSHARSSDHVLGPRDSLVGASLVAKALLGCGHYSEGGLLGHQLHGIGGVRVGSSRGCPIPPTVLWAARDAESVSLTVIQRSPDINPD